MVRQFLLNADGSIPEGTNVQALIDAGIPLVIPTSPPEYDYINEGVYLWQVEPIQGEDGHLYQAWELRDYPWINPNAPGNPSVINSDDIAQALAGLTDEQKQLIIKALS